MMDDAELLHRYAREGDESAFTELVQRRLPLVYAAAVRQVRDTELAKDVAQAVFVILARKAKKLGPDVVLSGWLYQTARFASQRAIRGEVRRIKRERDAAREGAQMEQSEPKNNQLESMLDELLGRMREGDRSVLVLRYFEGLSLAQIGDRLGTSEDAAQKRVARALERLRALFARRSVNVSSVALATFLTAQASIPVPSGLAAGVALTATSTAGVAPLTANLIEGTLNMMTWMKVKAMAPVGAAVALASSVPIAGLYQQNSALEKRNEALAAAVEQTKANVGQSSGKAVDLMAELERVREQAKEVHKLRGQVAQLTQERNDLRAQMEQLAQRAAAEPTWGAGASAAAVESSEDPQEAERMRMLNGMKRYALSLMMYAGANDGQFPQTIEDLREYQLSQAEEYIAIDELLMIDYGRIDSMQNPGESVVFASKETIGRDQAGNDLWAYAFGDGHSEISPFEVGEDGKLIQ